MAELRYPFTEEAVRALKAGDVVEVWGKVWTGRDRFHKHAAEGGALPVDLRDGAIYHCGPVAVPDEGAECPWKIVAAGPTTSVRENPYEPGLMERTGLRVIIGKGGMDGGVLEACSRLGAVYLQAVGGAAAEAARCIAKVREVHFLEEFGAAEACWGLEMEGFRCVVGMDSRGTSLFAEVEARSAERLEKLLK